MKIEPQYKIKKNEELIISRLTFGQIYLKKYIVKIKIKNDLLFYDLIILLFISIIFRLSI